MNRDRLLGSIGNWPEIIGLMFVLLLGFYRRMIFLAADLETLVKFVPDDAFYYLQVARNVAAGAGVTFDGINPTNGFHPLWMAIVSILAAVLREPMALLRGTLAVGALASTISAVLVYLLLKRFARQWWLALLGMAVFFLASEPFRASMNGLETALSTLLLLLAMYLVIGRPRTQLTQRTFIYLGLILGGLFLARTDNVFFIVVIFLAAIVETQKEGRLKRAALAAIGVTFVAGPWLSWNWYQFGTPMQSSGEAFPYVLHANHRLAGRSALEGVAHGLNLLGVLLSARRDILFTALLAFFLLILGRRPFFRAERRMCRLAMSQSAAVWMAMLVLVFVHTFVRWYPRPWYFAQAIVIELVTLALVLSLSPGERSIARVNALLSRVASVRLRQWVALLVVALASLLLVRAQIRSLEPPDYSHQIESLWAARWLTENLEESTRAAAFNAGVIGYFSDRPVVNLDGVINNRAYEAIQERAVFCFLRDSSVAYYLDYYPLMHWTYQNFFGEQRCPLELVEVTRIERANGSKSGPWLTIFRIE